MNFAARYSIEKKAPLRYLFLVRWNGAHEDQHDEPMHVMNAGGFFEGDQI
jgi:hypothetical protein